MTMTSLVGNKQSKHGVLEPWTTKDSIDVILSVDAWTLVESFDPGSHDPVTNCGQYSLHIKRAEVSIFKASTDVAFFSKHNEICNLKLGTDINSVEVKWSSG